MQTIKCLSKLCIHPLKSRLLSTPCTKTKVLEINKNNLGKCIDLL